MRRTIKHASDNTRTTRTLLQVLAGLLFLLVFYAGVTATTITSGERARLARTVVQSVTATPTASATRSFATPTATKSAVRAPQTILGQTQPDPNTVALYHFDSPTGNNQAPDATGHYPATLYGNAQVTTNGLYAGALQVDGNGSYVRTGHFDGIDFSQGTVEAFVDLQNACYTISPAPFIVFSAGGEYGSNASVMQLGVNIDNGDGYLAFGIFANGHWVYANSGITCRYLGGGKSGPLPPYDAWRFHHIAGTWGPRGVEIWVDGILHGVGIYPYPEPGNEFHYRCNPQMQMGNDPVFHPAPNPLYPVCETPVLVPTMTATPPGDYSGGLPPYNTFLIGCGASGQCFNGRIDEVRISNVQRTFAWGVDPEPTPLPTQTPDRIIGEYQVDASTMGLYHLNASGTFGELYNEVNGQWDGHPGGNAFISSNGRFTNALNVDGNSSYAEVPYFDRPSEGSIEAWFKLRSASAPFAILSAGSVPHNSPPWVTMLLGVDEFNGSTLKFKFVHQSTWYSVDSGVASLTLLGCWHHIAGTWGPHGMQIWIDGILRNTNATQVYPDSYDRNLFGCDGNGRCMNGIIDEVRFSRLQRSFSMRAPLVRSNAAPSARLSVNGVLVFLPLVEVAPTPPCPFGF